LLCRAGSHPDPLPADDDEFFERRIVPFAEALRMVLSDEITESFSKVAILQYAVTAGADSRHWRRRESDPGTETAVVYGWDRWARPTRRHTMLWTLFVVLLILWALGMVSSYTSAASSILLVIAVVVVLIRSSRADDPSSRGPSAATDRTMQAGGGDQVLRIYTRRTP
jgi:hypothetical protein